MFRLSQIGPDWVQDSFLLDYEEKSLSLIMTCSLKIMLYLKVCFFKKKNDFEVYTKEMHIFNVYNLMSLNICKCPLFHHHNWGDRHIQHCSKFPCAPRSCGRTLNKISTLLNFELYNTMLTMGSMLYSRHLELIHLE